MNLVALCSNIPGIPAVLHVFIANVTETVLQGMHLYILRSSKSDEPRSSEQSSHGCRRADRSKNYLPPMALLHPTKPTDIALWKLGTSARFAYGRLKIAP